MKGRIFAGISRKHRMICGRDDEPPQTITMQRLEYQLSTRGGRKGCD